MPVLPPSRAERPGYLFLGRVLTQIRNGPVARVIPKGLAPGELILIDRETSFRNAVKNSNDSVLSKNSEVKRQA